MADSGSYSWPGSVSSSPSVGTNGSTAPTSTDQVGGVGADGNLHPLSVTNTGVLNVNVSSSTVSPLPVTDAAAETSLASIDTKTPMVGQKAMAASSPVVLASDQSSIPVAATIQAGSAIIGNVRIDQTTPGTTNGVQVNAALPAGANVIGAVTQSGTWTVQPGNTPNTTSWLASPEKAATATLSNVASSATSVTVLALNTSRKQATIFNDSTQVLYLKLGATASSTSYTVQVAAGGYYELPGVRVYTGIIDGIWASANGNARVTELS